MKRRVHQISLGLVLLLSVSLFSCKKDLNDSVTGGKTKAGPIPSYQFQWDQATYVPSSPANSIPMPWNSGTTQITPDFVDDYKQVDGWELVYNTFTPTTPTSGSSMPYFFALYNKYRGVLRFYFWQPPTPVYSTYIQHGISLYSTSAANSPMFNFAANAEVDLATNASSASNIVQQQLAANGGTWVAYQYEIAYDPAVAASSFPSLGLGINAQYVNVSQVKLEGTQTGSLTGQIGTSSGGGFPLTGIAQNIAKGTFVVPGVAAMNQVMSDETNKKNPFLDIVSKTLTSALTGNVTGVLSGIISGIFGGGGTSAQKVSLMMDTKIDLTGTIVASGGLVNMKLAIPGQSNSQSADGLTPAFNSVMGTINLSAKPTVKVNRQMIQLYNQPQHLRYYWTHYTNFQLDPTTYNVLTNPALNGVASISNVSVEYLYLDDTPLVPDVYAITAGSSTPTGSTTAYGNVSLVRISAGVFSDTQPSPPYKPLNGRCVVRVKADIVPVSGAPTTTVIKTFTANVQII